MGADALVLFAVVVKDFQLAHPIRGGNQSNNKENPVDGIGSPPAMHKTEKIVRGKKVIYK
jgi:hypothetical protein